MYFVIVNISRGEKLGITSCREGLPLVAQTIKRLPTMQETQAQSLGWEDLLEKEMAIHSSILAWKIPWMEEPYSCKESDTTERLHFHFPAGKGIREFVDML